MHNFKIAWKLRTDPAASTDLRYFHTHARDAADARLYFHTHADTIGLNQGDTRIIYVSLA